MASDTITGLSYYAIPLALGYFVWKRPDIDFGWMFWMFAGFILACGTTHFFDVWTLWHPDYGIQGGVKAITAAISLTTAAMLWPLVPRLCRVEVPVTRHLPHRSHRAAFPQWALVEGQTRSRLGAWQPMSLQPVGSPLQ